MTWSQLGAVALLLTGGCMTSCGGGTTSSAGTAGDAGQGGAQPAEGGAATQVGGGTSAAGTAGDGSGGVVGSGGSGAVNCDMVGCAMPPLCSEGCQDPCGCCPCSEGDTMASAGSQYVCTGGCWAPVGEGCEHQGITYPVGATVDAGDGCNTCTCQNDGALACTQMACDCDPVAEARQREYVTEDPETCTFIDFVCPDNTTYFSNACGCGCAQDPACPEWFNCMPSPDAPPCDEAQIHADCPYSGIAY